VDGLLLDILDAFAMPFFAKIKRKMPQNKAIR